MNLKEKELFQACRKNKPEGHEGIYRLFYAFGMSVCLRYAPTRDDALEILNDSFMKVFENIRSFDQSRPFKGWFRKIIVNTALDHYRAQKKYRLSIDAETDLPEVVVEPDFEKNLSADEILELFAYLPEVHRITFNLYEVEGYSHDEIAAMLDVSPGTSRSNLSRAKKMLQKLYLEKKNNQCNEAV